jgi:hypothetical protein
VADGRLERGEFLAGQRLLGNRDQTFRTRLEQRQRRLGPADVAGQEQPYFCVPA